MTTKTPYSLISDDVIASHKACRNRLINSNFVINQLEKTGTVTLAANEYGHDGWKAGASGCTYTFATSGIDTIINITAGSLKQVIAAKNVEGGCYILSHHGTAQARISVNGAATSGAYTVASKASPLKSASATVNQTITVEFSTGTLDRVQLEPTAFVTPYERIDPQDSLNKCYHYFIRDNLACQGYTTAGGTIQLNYKFPQAMASSTPNISFWAINQTNSGDPGNYGTTVRGCTIRVQAVATGSVNTSFWIDVSART